LTCLLDPSGPHGTRFTVENRPYPRALRSRAPSSPAHLPVVAIAGLRSLANRARSSKPDTDADLDQLPAEATHTVDQYKASIADQPVARVLRISRETPCYPQRPALYRASKSTSPPPGPPAYLTPGWGSGGTPCTAGVEE